MREKLYIVLWVVLGLTGYIMMYHTNLSDDVKWEVYFNTDKSMDMVLILTIYQLSKKFGWEYKMLLWAMIITVSLDLSRNIYNLFSLERQQGNYAEYFEHSSGVVFILATGMFVLSKADNIKKWLKSLLKF